MCRHECGHEVWTCVDMCIDLFEERADEGLLIGRACGILVVVGETSLPNTALVPFWQREQPRQ